MKFSLDSLLPETSSAYKKAQAKVVALVSMSIGGAMLALVLYWVFTSTLEDIETVIIMVVLLTLLAGNVHLVKRGYVTLGAWLLVGLLLLLNLSNIAWYGISNVASAALVIPILLAAFGVGPKEGMGVTLLGCGAIFLIAYLASIGQLQTEIPYQESTLSFDAPTLSLILLIVGVMAAGWVRSTKEAFEK